MSTLQNSSINSHSEPSGCVDRKSLNILACCTSYIHLNPVIAQLERGETVYGVVTEDFSLYHARELAQAPIHFVYADFEHNPMNFESLHYFLMGMSDKKTILEKRNLQPNVALFARFPTDAIESSWAVKQALDIGLHGIIFNGIDNSAQALAAIKTMRYPKLTSDPYFAPKGKRGFGPRNAAWIWGLSLEEYEKRADLWPLNPEGDLLAIVMIESEEAVNHLGEIAATPGVGLLFVGGGNDLSRSMGVLKGSEEIETVFQKVLKACKDNQIASGISAKTVAEIKKRKKEGWSLIRAPLQAIQEFYSESG